MGMTADEITQKMSAAEFTEHWAEFQTDPWDEQRADYRSGIIASILFNVNRGKDQPAKQVTDFMPYRPKEDEAEMRKRFIKGQQHKRRRR